MGNPTDNTALLRQRSPITHVDQFEGSLLILHGAKDVACPANHTRRFRAVLIEHGVEEGQEFEYREFEDQGHALVEHEQINRHWHTVEAFLTRQLNL